MEMEHANCGLSKNTWIMLIVVITIVASLLTWHNTAPGVDHEGLAEEINDATYWRVLKENGNPGDLSEINADNFDIFAENAYGTEEYWTKHGWALDGGYREADIYRDAATDAIKKAGHELTANSWGALLPAIPLSVVAGYRAFAETKNSSMRTVLATVYPVLYVILALLIIFTAVSNDIFKINGEAHIKLVQNVGYLMLGLTLFNCAYILIPKLCQIPCCSIDCNDDGKQQTFTQNTRVTPEQMVQGRMNDLFAKIYNDRGAREAKKAQNEQLYRQHTSNTKGEFEVRRRLTAASRTTPIHDRLTKTMQL